MAVPETTSASGARSASGRKRDLGLPPATAAAVCGGTSQPAVGRTGLPVAGGRRSRPALGHGVPSALPSAGRAARRSRPAAAPTSGRPVVGRGGRRLPAAGGWLTGGWPRPAAGRQLLPLHFRAHFIGNTRLRTSGIPSSKTALQNPYRSNAKWMIFGPLGPKIIQIRYSYRDFEERFSHPGKINFSLGKTWYFRCSETALENPYRSHENL